MKKALLTALTLLAACFTASADAAERQFNVLLTGGPEANVLDVKLSADGRLYLIDSMLPLEAGGGICNPGEGVPNRLECEATAIASFEVNAGSGDDSVIISPKITLPVTLRGGPGNDRLRGGGGNDKLIGGPGDDMLFGHGGNDWIYGGPGDDWLYGLTGDDRLDGGPGADVHRGGSGDDLELRNAQDFGGTWPPPAARSLSGA